MSHFYATYNLSIALFMTSHVTTRKAVKARVFKIKEENLPLYLDNLRLVNLILV